MVLAFEQQKQSPRERQQQKKQFHMFTLPPTPIELETNPFTLFIICLMIFRNYILLQDVSCLSRSTFTHWVSFSLTNQAVGIKRWVQMYGAHKPSGVPFKTGVL